LNLGLGFTSCTLGYCRASRNARCPRWRPSRLRSRSRRRSQKHTGRNTGKIMAFNESKWKRISCKYNTRWQHMSRL